MNKKKAAGENVRKVTSKRKNAAIDQLTLSNIRKYSGKSPDEISQRIRELDKEWDIERVLDLGMSALALSGIASSLVINRYSIILPMLLLLFFIWHALEGWCPPIPLLRHFKVRTRPEIDREKYALKAIRGDFDDLSASMDASDAFSAVQKIECLQKLKP